MKKISERMTQIAYEFESAAIEAGFVYARITWQAPEWSLDGTTNIRVFAVDQEDKSDIWKGGE